MTLTSISTIKTNDTSQCRPQRTLDECEARISASLIQAADDLRHIREHRLYTEAGIDTWNDYCTDRLGISKRRADQLIMAGEVQAELGTIVPDLTLNEAHARALAPIRDDPNYMAEVVSEASLNGKLTAAAIADAIDRRRAEELTAQINARMVELNQSANALWEMHNSTRDAEVQAACIDGIALFGRLLVAVADGDIDTLLELAGEAGR